MKKTMLKSIFGLALFTVAFTGLKLKQDKIKMAGEEATVTTIDLSQQALAYCNEAFRAGEINDGLCSGEHNNASSRCFPSQLHDCVQ